MIKMSYHPETKEKINLHLSDINDVITEDDIKNFHLSSYHEKHIVVENGIVEIVSKKNLTEPLPGKNNNTEKEANPWTILS